MHLQVIQCMQDMLRLQDVQLLLAKVNLSAQLQLFRVSQQVPLDITGYDQRLQL